MVAALCGGVALGSWLAMIPVVLFAALFVRRTLLGDAMLVRELPGYAPYAKTVRYRLLPGVF
jgi:protein-S-isoprenylcysteine O-methyltransferase Ste14